MIVILRLRVDAHIQAYAAKKTAEGSPTLRSSRNSSSPVVEHSRLKNFEALSAHDQNEEPALDTR
jgi:hypothetical protein